MAPKKRDGYLTQRYRPTVGRPQHQPPGQHAGGLAPCQPEVGKEAVQLQKENRLHRGAENGAVGYCDHGKEGDHPDCQHQQGVVQHRRQPARQAGRRREVLPRQGGLLLRSGSGYLRKRRDDRPLGPNGRRTLRGSWPPACPRSSQLAHSRRPSGSRQARWPTVGPSAPYITV